jgi:hypothetical protein
MPKTLSVPLTNVASHSTAYYLLQALNEIGIEYLFCNFGTDHAPLIEELARFEADGLRAPKVVLCPHENVGVHMAGGYAQITGRGQAVLVHVDAGTANAALGMHNLSRNPDTGSGYCRLGALHQWATLRVYPDARRRQATHFRRVCPPIWISPRLWRRQAAMASGS